MRRMAALGMLLAHASTPCCAPAAPSSRAGRWR